MTKKARWATYLAAAFGGATLVILPAMPHVSAAAMAQGAKGNTEVAANTKSTAHAKKSAVPKPPPVGMQVPQLPPRIPFTAADEAAASIPGMPDARFWADSETDFNNALPKTPGPWLILSSGGSDGAFGAGFVNGLTAAGNRADYAVVTGVSTGALIAPFAFAGPKYDDALRDAFTKVSAADIFEIRLTGESLLDSWPLKDLIAKEITPALLADIAVEHNKGRRLFVVTTDLDAERSVVWNLGAIAAHGGDDAVKLFRTVLLASTAIPGGFPPVLVDVEANGKKFQELHVDGGVGGQFFVAPAKLMASAGDYRLPATQLYIVIDTGLEPEFEVVDRSLGTILARSVGAAVKVDTRLMIDRAYVVAKRSNVGFNIATIPSSFNTPSHGAFDTAYMTALYQAGFDLAKSARPFSIEPPPYPGRPVIESSDGEKTGANR